MSKQIQYLQSLKLDTDLDQHFLISEKIIKEIVEQANLTNTDVVLEIGAGIGNLTKFLAAGAGRVIAVEYDKRFMSQLNELPQNVSIIFESATQIPVVRQGGKVWKTKEYNKIISAPPYSILEWWLHNITFVKFDLSLLVVPEGFFYSVRENCVFSSFFEPEIVFMVPKDAFYPKPKTNSVLMKLNRLPDAIDTKNLSLFLSQYLYQCEDRKVKNTLREGLIQWEKSVNNKELSKKEAHGIIEKKNFTKSLLEQPPNNKTIYLEVKEKFK